MCFIKHNWGDWNHYTLHQPFRRKLKQNRQARRCWDCGDTQDKRVKDIQ